MLKITGISAAIAASLAAFALGVGLTQVRAQVVQGISGRPVSTNITFATSTASSGVVYVGSNSYVVSGGNGGLVYGYSAIDIPARPAGARWHAVTDTYYDDAGKIVGKQVSAHFVDPAYCQPGRTQQELVAQSHRVMPQAVRLLVGDAAPADPGPDHLDLPATPPVAGTKVAAAE